jgi:CPA1 family monovalent cation:H+ antiporter
MLGRSLHVPYTLALVIVGLGLALLDIRLATLSPALILQIFLPPLLFEASWNTQWKELRRNLLPVCLFALLGVVIVIVGTAVGLTQLAGLPLTTALLIAASLSATDPVAVTALFRELGVSRRTTTIMEGESLFNDGMAIVAFGFLLELSLGSTTLSVQPIVVQLLVVIGIGLIVGLIFGFGISYLTQRFDLPLVEQSLTLVAAYATYLLAEELGGSGVIAAVTTGIILGNFGSRIGMSPRTRIIVSEFWEFLAFFINSFLFLLVGTQVQFNALLANLPLILVAIVGMLLTRAVSIYGLGNISNTLGNLDISLPEQTVLWWGGLRGAVSIALALSLPEALPGRETIISTVFGAVLFTLLAQGLTIQPLLKLLNLLGDQPLRQEYGELTARQTALTRVLEYLGAIDRPGVDPEFLRYQTSLVKGEISTITDKIEKLLAEYPNLQNFMNEQLRQELLDVEANTYAQLVQTGQLQRELAPLLDVVLKLPETD